MRPFRTHVYFTLGLFCFVLFILMKTLHLGNTARLVPEKIALFCLPLLLVQVIADLFPSIEKRARSFYKSIPGRKDAASLKEDHQDVLAREGSSPAHRREAGLVWVLMIPVLVYIFGLNPAVFIYSFVYIKFKGRTGWLRSLLVAGILGISIYLIFEHALGMPLYRGQLLRWLGI